jgi:hypothetical protein
MSLTEQLEQVQAPETVQEYCKMHLCQTPKQALGWILEDEPELATFLLPLFGPIATTSLTEELSRRLDQALRSSVTQLPAGMFAVWPQLLKWLPDVYSTAEKMQPVLDYVEEWNKAKGVHVESTRAWLGALARAVYLRYAAVDAGNKTAWDIPTLAAIVHQLADAEMYRRHTQATDDILTLDSQDYAVLLEQRSWFVQELQKLL